MNREDNDALHDRAWALVDAMAAWGAMRHAMERAQPGTSHDCWWTVGKSLCDIASHVKADAERFERSAA